MEQTDNKVLYIDDENINLMLFREMFSRYFTIYTANSAKEAEKLMSQLSFKVIVSDINMPHETGLQFFNRLVRTETSPIFVILTAYVSDRLLLEALNNGKIFRYITKPFDIKDVKETLYEAIGQYDLINEKHQLNNRILESQRNFYNIFQSSKDGIVIIDQDEVILESNKSFQESIRTQIEDLSGQNLYDLIPDEFQEQIRDRIFELFNSISSISEFEYYTKAEEKITVELNTSSINYKGKKAILVIMRDISERRFNELKLLNAVVEAEEKERSRIAKDLHDGLGPIMSSLKMYLEWLNKQENLNDHPDILDLSLTSINEAIMTLKRVANNLSPHILEKFGLVAALNKYVDNYKKISKVRFNTNIHLPVRLELTTEISLYRIITECITNTLKHAQASSIEIMLRQDERNIYFSYKDNGKGISVSEDEKYEKGLGLHNINNRIKTLGGKIMLLSSPGDGFTLNSEIPIV